MNKVGPINKKERILQQKAQINETNQPKTDGNFAEFIFPVLFGFFILTKCYNFF